MADLKIRFNLENDDIELVLNDEVIDTVGVEVVESWVNAYNEKHGFVKPESSDNVEDTEKDDSEQDDTEED